jgi:MFS family permease
VSSLLTEPTTPNVPDPISGSKPKQRLFYGWVIVGAVFVQLMFAAGLTFYGLPLFLNTLTKERGFSVFAVSLATSTFWVASGITGIVVARLLTRFDPRVFIAGGAVVASICMVLIGRLTELWQLYPVYAFFGAGFTCTAVLVANTVITRWFHRRRSVALSVATTGLSVGGIVLTPIAARLLNGRTISSAMTTIAIMFFLGVVIIPVIAIRPDPRKMGLAPDGDAALPTSSASPTVVPGIDFGAAMRSVAFVAITATFALALLGQVGGISQLVRLAVDRSGKATGAKVISVLAACSVVGRLTGGAVVSRFSSHRFATGALCVQAFGLATLAFAQTPTAIYIGAGVFGLGVGNVLLLHPLLLAEVFGVRDYPRIYGRSALFVAGGNAIGPLAMGWLRDHGGGYRSAYLLAAFLNVLAMIIYSTRGAVAPAVQRQRFA